MHRYWAVWKHGARNEAGRYKKPPRTPSTGQYAQPNRPETFESYSTAYLAYETGDWAGVGVLLTAGDPYAVLDPDDCRDSETGELTAFAQDLIARFNSYTEVSPSGTGIRIVMKGTLPGSTTPYPGVQAWDRVHFVTLTGQHIPGTPRTIEYRQAELDAWYDAAPARRTLRRRTHQEPLKFPRLSDDAILEKARAAKNGAKFSRLWEGDGSGYATPSEADLALCCMLAFYTRDPDQIDRLFQRSGLYRPGRWEQRSGPSTYGQRTIEAALGSGNASYKPRKRAEPPIVHVHPWQQRSESSDGREAYLSGLAETAKEQLQAHIQAREAMHLVIALPPGVGKTRRVRELGKDFSLAWIAERHDMYGSVTSPDAPYRHIQLCTAENCSDPATHALVSGLGYKVWPLHRQHACPYYLQFAEQGSAFYQIAHVPTAFPKQHDTAIVDELNLPNWLIDDTITLDQITRVRQGLIGRDWRADSLLRGMHETLVEVGRTGAQPHGKALFDALNRQCRGQLQTYIEHVATIDALMTVRPALPSDVDSAGMLEHARARGPVILPTLVRALQAELPRWLAGGEWNSRLHIGGGELHILRPRRFSLEEGEVLPVVILDATADEHLLSLLLGAPVRVERPRGGEVVPPPRMQHIAVRSGKRYAKTSLIGRIGADGEKRGRQGERPSMQDEYLDRVVRELLFLLGEIDPQGIERTAERVGIITYKECQDALGERLGIPEHRRGHFWGVRGSNAFNDCTILLVVGTPTPELDQIGWWARALYADDPTPIDTTSEKVEGAYRYRDARMQRLVEYLIGAELTQVAHRNRPLRYDGRVVVTLTTGEINHLPITTEYTSLPDLTAEGEPVAAARERAVHKKLRRAAIELVRRGEQVGPTKLAKMAEVRKAAASKWYREVWCRAGESVV